MLKFRSKMPLAAIVAAALLVVSACSSGGSDSSDTSSGSSVAPTDSGDGGGSPEPGSADGAFKVIGKDIVDPNGNLFVPMGANIGAPVVDSAGKEAWIFRLNGDDITTPESAAAVEEWGWNFLRVNAECSAQTPSENAPWGNEEMFTALDEVIDLYTSQGIVVAIECHDLTGESPSIDDPVYLEIAEFWKAAAERYGDNGYVWFNHLNEFDDGQSPETEWQAVIDDAYNLFLETGTNNLVIFDLPNFGQRLPVMADPQYQEWSKTMCNVIWGWHSYGAVAPPGGDVTNPEEEAFNAEITKLLDNTVAAEIPILIGEFGYDWDSNRKTTLFNYPAERFGALAALKFGPPRGYGLAVWHANGASPTAMTFGLKNSDDQTFAQPAPSENLSEMGQLFWDLSQAQKAAAPQPGPDGESCTR